MKHYKYKLLNIYSFVQVLHSRFSILSTYSVLRIQCIRANILLDFLGQSAKRNLHFPLKQDFGGFFQQGKGGQEILIPVFNEAGCMPNTKVLTLLNGTVQTRHR